MAKQIVIHREKYKDLPLRFQKKLEHDLQYVTNAGIPGLKKNISFWELCKRRSEEHKRHRSVDTD